MSQYDFSVLDPQVVTGTVLAEDLNSWRDAVHSTHLGVARPSYVRQGMLWLDSSSQNLLVLYLYDGVEDIAVGTFNTNNHTSSIGGGVQGADITTPDAVALWDSTTGKLLKNGVLITESVNDTTAGRLLQVGATKAQLGADVVGTTGNQTIAGIKTFSSKLAVTSSISANASEGAVGQVLQSGGAGQPAVWGNKVITSGIPVTASGTNADFTGIPSWAKRITVLLDYVGLTGTGNIQIKGGSGVIDSTGYDAKSTILTTAPSITAVGATDSFANIGRTNATAKVIAKCVISKLTGNTWIAETQAFRTVDNSQVIVLSDKTFTGDLDRISVVAGAGTFNAGTINIMWE